MLMDEKYIGLALAASSSLLIGVSFIITKKGLMASTHAHGAPASDAYHYLRNPIWWLGMMTMALGEIANFAAYSFAPAVLVTPLGALSVLISSVLASWLLGERMGTNGKLGSILCLLGAVVIVLHAPEDKEITSVDEMMSYAIQPGFLFYCTFVVVFSIWMIQSVVPRYGKRSVLVYVSICSLVGSVSVMAVKAFGIALKLTLMGENQLTHPSTYVFCAVVVAAIAVQMTYFNKALDTFTTNLVTPIYYVFFTTATIVASSVLFRGMGEAGVVDTVSLLCGFLEIFIGVFLLNEQRMDASSLSRRASIVRLSSAPTTPSFPPPPNHHPSRRRSRPQGSTHRRSHSGSLSGYAPPMVLDDVLEEDGFFQKHIMSEEEEEEEARHLFMASDETVLTVDDDHEEGDGDDERESKVRKGGFVRLDMSS